MEVRETEKGVFLYAVLRHEGRATRDVLAERLPMLIREFPWPKSMRWGAGDLRWVRPIRSILALFDGQTVPFALDGIHAGDTTFGHRFLSADPVRVTGVAEYRKALADRYVLLDHAQRMERVHALAQTQARKAGFVLREDAALVVENAGLAEWPVPMIGHFDEAYLALPEEVLVTAMAYHQKVFALDDPKTGRLAPAFVFVADRDPAIADGQAIIRGNERVLAARLADARFFWEQDLKIPLEERLDALRAIVFHERLGSLRERVARFEALIDDLAHCIPDLDQDMARRAARLAKCDLVTGTVGEFPELQGVIGARLAAAQGEPEAIARAIEEHYAPKGPSDRCPDAPVSVAVALAEKIDTLVGFFGIGETPTGSKDPFALRRAALGVIRLIVENALRVDLARLFESALQHYLNQGRQVVPATDELLAFFADRLKVQSREKGVRHDLIDAVFAAGRDDDLVRLLKRVEALQRFIESPDGANLLTGYKRAANIARIEEKKDSRRYREAPDPSRFVQQEERALSDALDAARAAASKALADEDYEAAMRALAALRPAVDAFFDRVTVNAPEPELRANRLRLLNAIREAVDAVADFSKIEG
ncbi:MAG: glycine--tRNA ligase subunit beta [Alphaproteobacteria bacterium]|nr:MAG: glycine--tRNA ligase subunit beta [Alphaproteobacteria bacterium]